ncbi:MAG: chemotaxis protein CheW [Gammaproteobacteria bacterium]|nr:chemotaxis protein CheW [Gammaproteobacteria bacterium]
MSKAFDTLYELAERSQSVAAELPPRENAQTHWNGLGFSLLGQRFVVPMYEVAELLRVPQTTSLPGVKSSVVGVANVRGRLLVVIDVGLFLGEASTFARAQRRILAYDAQETYFGFMVDESLGMQHFPSESFAQSVSGVDEKFWPFVNGCYSVSGTVWPVFSLKKLAEDPAFETLASSAA